MRHPNLADKSDSCLVVVDMQEPFLNVMFDRQLVTENVRKLISIAKIFDLPVLVTVQNPERMGDTVPEIQELLPSVQPISKMSFSCCGDQAFVDQLAALEKKTSKSKKSRLTILPKYEAILATVKKKTVIICGIETHICVNQTVHDLLADGYKVHVPEDAVCSRSQANWRAGLEKMRQSGAVITCTEAVMYELLECAGTAEFRQALKLVK